MDRSDAREVMRLLHSLRVLDETQRNFREGLMVLRLLELLTIMDRYRQEHQHRPDDVWSIEDTVNFIDANFAQEHSLPELVARCALNTTDFSRLFKERTGYPLFEYINRVRIHRACILLKKTRQSILDIALSVGYNNVSFFNRYFHRIMGITPTDFRTRS